MSKKEESLRRGVLSREGSDRDRAAKRRATQALLAVSVVASGVSALVPQPRVDYDAERGRFSSGDHHPDKCSCAKCAAWRLAERYR